MRSSQVAQPDITQTCIKSTHDDTCKFQSCKIGNRYYLVNDPSKSAIHVRDWLQYFNSFTAGVTKGFQCFAELKISWGQRPLMIYYGQRARIFKKISLTNIPLYVCSRREMVKPYLYNLLKSFSK